MRLIDADKLKIYLKEYLHYGHAIPWIDAQPTAYDIEKVVAELEKEKEIHTEHYNISIYKDFPEIKSRYKQIQLVINHAIDIVRKGGIE